MQFTRPTHRIHRTVNHSSIYQNSYDEQIEKNYNEQEQFFGRGSACVIKSERQSTMFMYDNYRYGEKEIDETVITVRTV